MKTTLLLLEDDAFTADLLIRSIEERFHPAIEIVWIECERDFVRRLPELRRLPARITAAIVDAQMPWDDGDGPIGSGAPGDSSEAGIRMLTALRSDQLFASLPVMLYTVSDRSRLFIPEGLSFEYMRKDEPEEKILEWVGKYCF